MIPYTAKILCQGLYLFLAIQQVNAKLEDYISTRLTVWDSFDWKITIQRQRQDNIALKGFFKDSVDLEDIKIPGATCNETENWTAKSGRPGGFVVNCTCNLGSSTFDAKRMVCVANNKLKQGCRFTTGSWRWSTSWRWDKVDDPLTALDIKHLYGITTGFNATAIEYQLCAVQSISYLAENKTKGSNSFFNHSKPAMFKLHNIWHFSWNVDNMRAEVKKSLEGKIIKFQIECEKPGPTNNEDEDLQISSCILVKVTGQLTVESKSPGMSQISITENTDAPTTAASDENAFLIPLLVSLAIILTVAVVIAIAVCYTRRLVCFEEKEQSHEITALNETVVKTGFMKNSNVKSFA